MGKLFFVKILFYYFWYCWYQNNCCFLDYAHPWQLSFQDPASPVMEGIVALHHDLMFILTVIGIFVSWLLFRIIYFFNHKKNLIPSTITHGTKIEIIWTIIPSIILMIIAIPSFALLYSIDEVIDPVITLKVIGHQWFWSYEYNDYSNLNGNCICFDSYMIADDDLQEGNIRLLEVDNKVILPVFTHIRTLITATDVLHSWTIPSLGVKMDACPGRLNQVSIFMKREGVFYGQCSEICGIQHGFMPIVVNGISINDYIKWVVFQLESKNWFLYKLKFVVN